LANFKYLSNKAFTSNNFAFNLANKLCKSDLNCGENRT